MRLIDADAIPYEPLPKGDRNYRTYNLDDAYEDGYNDAMVDVRNSPTIEERKTGQWEQDNPFAKPVCSECGEPCFGLHGFDYTLTPYCPNCGAKMKKPMTIPEEIINSVLGYDD